MTAAVTATKTTDLTEIKSPLTIFPTSTVDIVEVVTSIQQTNFNTNSQFHNNSIPNSESELPDAVTATKRTDLTEIMPPPKIFPTSTVDIIVTSIQRTSSITNSRFDNSRIAIGGLLSSIILPIALFVGIILVTPIICGYVCIRQRRKKQSKITLSGTNQTLINTATNTHLDLDTVYTTSNEAYHSEQERTNITMNQNVAYHDFKNINKCNADYDYVDSVRDMH